MALFRSFYGWVVFRCIYGGYLIYDFKFALPTLVHLFLKTAVCGPPISVTPCAQMPSFVKKDTSATLRLRSYTLTTFCKIFPESRSSFPTSCISVAHYLEGLFICLVWFVFLGLRPAYGSSRLPARGWIGAVAAGLHHSSQHANRILTHWVKPGIEPESSWILFGFITAEPWQELLLGVLICWSSCWAAAFLAYLSLWLSAPAGQGPYISTPQVLVWYLACIWCSEHAG